MLSKKDGEELLKIARRTIENFFDNKKLEIKKTKFNKISGVFVTIHKNNDLRGCIGYPMPVIPLGEAIQRAAISAAFEDPRFQPLKKIELPKIKIEISVLTKPELIKVKSEKEYFEKIKIGEDGLIVEYGLNSGLLLPQVAIEHNLDVKEFLEHTCYKAGLNPSKWLDKKVKIYKFQAQIFRD